MLEIEALCRQFNRRRVLHEVSLCLQDGEYVAIVGESGVGKSTLLNVKLTGAARLYRAASSDRRERG